MLRALIKKQFLAAFRPRSGKGRKRGSLVLYAFLMLYLAAVFGFLFFTVMRTLCAPLYGAGLAWLYFTYAILMATVLAVVGSVFMAQSQLYDARDNELLLSLPIPPKYILLCRMLPLYVQNLLFEALVLLPAFLVYGMTAGVSAARLLCWLVLLLTLPLLSLALSCVLGWLISLITSRIRNKNLFTIVLSLAFLAAYYYVYTRFMRYLQVLLANSAAIGASIRTRLYPVYQMGRAGEGNLPALLFSAAASLVLFALVYFILSRTYIRIATAKRGTAKLRYREKTLKVRSQAQALLRKERLRFTGSATYLLNCGLGVLFLLVGAVLLIAKRAWLLSMLALVFPGASDVLPLLGCLAVCMVSSLNMVSAPSVSLEGKSLWLLQSLPVSGRQILAAKLRLHVLVSVPAAVLCCAALIYALRVRLFMALLLLITPAAFILLFGEIGLVCNLKKPNLNWDNEAIAVKQSASVLLTMCLCWLILFVPAIIYLLVGTHIAGELYLLCCFAAASGGFLWLRSWLNRRGAALISYM